MCYCSRFNGIVRHVFRNINKQSSLSLDSQNARHATGNEHQTGTGRNGGRRCRGVERVI